MIIFDGIVKGLGYVWVGFGLGGGEVVWGKLV